jgi:hypothetical protein
MSYTDVWTQCLYLLSQNAVVRNYVEFLVFASVKFKFSLVGRGSGAELVADVSKGPENSKVPEK